MKKLKKQIKNKLKNKMFVLWLLGLLSTQNIIYPQSGIVTNVDYKNNIVTFQTFSGIEYQFNDCDDWIINDCVSCIMFTNYTDNVYDDIIIKYEYDGYFGDFWNY